MSLRTVRSALRKRTAADATLQSALQELGGEQRREGLRLAIEAGVPARELALMLGVSRQYIYREAGRGEQP